MAVLVSCLWTMLFSGMDSSENHLPRIKFRKAYDLAEDHCSIVVFDARVFHQTLTGIRALVE